MENLPAIAVTFIVIALIVLAAFAHKASRDGADKAAFRLLWFLSAVLVGTIGALIAGPGWG